MRRRRRMLVAGAVVVLVAAFGLAAGALRKDDGDDERATRTLVDGSPARPAPAALNLGPGAVLARGRLLPAAERGPDVQACLRLAGLVEPARSPVLELVGLEGRSLTFRVERGRALAACEAGVRRREPGGGGPWCGVTHGRLYDGRLRDGRLGMAGCLDAERRTVAFGWVEPAPGAAWLAVRGERATEVYRVMPGFPLRVTTRDVRVERSSAVFDVAQFAADGRRIRSGAVEMSVAG